MKYFCIFLAFLYLFSRSSCCSAVFLMCHSNEYRAEKLVEIVQFDFQFIEFHFLMDNPGEAIFNVSRYLSSHDLIITQRIRSRNPDSGRFEPINKIYRKPADGSHIYDHAKHFSNDHFFRDYSFTLISPSYNETILEVFLSNPSGVMSKDSLRQIKIIVYDLEQSNNFELLVDYKDSSRSSKLLKCNRKEISPVSGYTKRWKSSIVARKITSSVDPDASGSVEAAASSSVVAESKIKLLKEEFEALRIKNAIHNLERSESDHNSLREKLIKLSRKEYLKVS